MIRLKSMSWSHALSYGADNTINFSANDLVQLIGKNGHGKSSIALILEEVLYNKNSKNIKKSDILNRYSKSKNYTIQLEFDKDGDTYIISTVRGTTQSVKLLKNGEDISAHTSTGTYSLIESIIGLDHKAFTQIVYQSSASSLEFLTATDTNRKKFLIELLSLSKYTRIADLFKDLVKSANSEVDSLSVKVKTVSDWLIKFGKEDLTKKELLPLPVLPTKESTEAEQLEIEIKNIVATNNKIITNNKYKEILSGINIDSVEKPNKDINTLKLNKISLANKVKDLEKTINGTNISDTCSACGQPIDNSHKKTIIAEAKASILQTKFDLEIASRNLVSAEEAQKLYDKSISSKLEWEKYHSLINNTIRTTPLDRTELENKLKELNNYIKRITNDIATVQKHNNEVSAHNAKVDVISGQMNSMKNDLTKYKTALDQANYTLNNLQILVKTFSTTGLIAYKIECLVKDLEKLTNHYLIEMSDGRFQLSFKVNASDKLNVVITDNGKDIDILALSTGERARVNVSTLLAIRKLMQSLSNSRINLLILDETIESLDAEGKDKLIEVLLKEEHLNTILVSHGFTHPLLEKISIVKENNISRIE